LEATINEQSKIKEKDDEIIEAEERLAALQA